MSRKLIQFLFASPCKTIMASTSSSHCTAFGSIEWISHKESSKTTSSCCIIPEAAAELRTESRRSFLRKSLPTVFAGGVASTSIAVQASSSTLSNWQEGTIEVFRRGQPYKMFYKISHPEFLFSKTHPPLVTIHGGPSVPSDYMLPLADVLSPTRSNANNNNVVQRSIIFFDQIGCGSSESPKDKIDYSVRLTLLDLQTLIESLQLQRYHLYGHSYGGMLAYEFIRRGFFETTWTETETGIKKENVEKCQSLVLSSSPLSTKQTYEELTRIGQELLRKDPNPFTFDERFRKTCRCRSPKQPKPLEDAYNKVGKVWYGLDVVIDFECLPLPPSSSFKTSSLPRMPNALILRGEYDFVTQDVLARWAEPGRYFHHNSIRTKVFEGCSHHVLFENGEDYGKAINAFLVDNDST